MGTTNRKIFPFARVLTATLGAAVSIATFACSTGPLKKATKDSAASAPAPTASAPQSSGSGSSVTGSGSQVTGTGSSTGSGSADGSSSDSPVDTGSSPSTDDDDGAPATQPVVPTKPTSDTVLLIFDGFDTCPSASPIKKEDMALYDAVLKPALAAVAKKNQTVGRWILTCKSAESAADSFFFVSSDAPDAAATSTTMTATLDLAYAGITAGKAKTFVYAFSQGGGEAVKNIPAFAGHGALVMTTVDPIDSTLCNLQTVVDGFLTLQVPPGCQTAPTKPDGFTATFTKAGNSLANFYLNKAEFILHSGVIAATAGEFVTNTDVTADAVAHEGDKVDANITFLLNQLPLATAQKQGILAHTAARLLPAPIAAFMQSLAGL